MCHHHRHRRDREYHSDAVTPRRDPVVRISDTDREQAITRLGEHAAEGRLTPDELDERSDAVLAARTHADLEPLFADLPRGSSRSARDVRARYARGKIAVMSVIAAAWGLSAIAHNIF